MGIMTEEEINDWENLVNYVAYEFSKKYHMVDRQDISQEIWVWFLTHQKKLAEWHELPRPDQTKLVSRSIRNAALKFCEREKARMVGYELSDLFYYDKATVEIFLPSIVSGDYEIPETLLQGGQRIRGSADPSEGNGWLAMRADISAGYDKLPEHHQNVLTIRFLNESGTYKQLGDALSCSEEAARKRVDRALQALINKIGGFRP
jgi:DNA-directed RNA polymerase specialized sigma24 family protein